MEEGRLQHAGAGKRYCGQTPDPFQYSVGSAQHQRVPKTLVKKLAFVWDRSVIIFDNYRGEEHMWIRVGRKIEVEFEHVGPAFISKSPGKSTFEAKQLFFTSDARR